MYAKPLAAFRASQKCERHSSSVGAWLRQGERKAEEIRCQEYDKQVFKQTLSTLRELTTEPDPKRFIPKLKENCSKAGVAVVVEPAPKGCPASGATRWLMPEKALLMLSVRHKSNDHFWFSFFHEAGHLLLHGKKLLFIEVEGEFDGKMEDEADEFARDILIPPSVASQLSTLPKTTEAVTRLAKRIGIAPGIVVGRMQKEELLPWTHLNGLKVRYAWTHE